MSQAKTTVLLGVSASVACYKACTLASRLTQAGVDVDTVLTAHAAQLVAPRLFAALTSRVALSDEFAPEASAAMSHIELADHADLFVVAPASAATLGRLANGLADDLLSTCSLALRAGVPRWVAPAMNPRMYAHVAVQRNLARLAEDGWEILTPGSGWMACGDEGEGRLMEPEDLLERILAWRDERA